MQRTTTRTPATPGWAPLPGSWEEAVLTWYEQAPRTWTRPSDLRRPTVVSPDRSSLPKPRSPRETDRH